ncbi:MFS transporter [Ilyomonas limi]|uniref:MFS transporter n=1 Tax=Ilyomonas limi TaxID=2575867 RepID=A0A4U3KXL8_9BACT|nr:MFS transporter [Ilyomonas limi]TKK67381.1 MFS transporter [Ilyomonas limi]
MALPSSLRALRYYNFRLYFVGQAVSLIGTWMQRLAVSWLVYTITHSAFWLGVVAFAGQIPILLLSPYAGAYVDRHSRYRTLLKTQIASMVQAGLLALIVFINFYNIAAIIFLSVALGIINAFDTPARQSMMIVLVREKTDLPNAIALNSSMVTLARLIGPAAGGILLSSYGEDVCFFLNFISFVAVIGSLLMMKIKVPERTKPKEHIWQNLHAGYQYLKHHNGLRSAILHIALISLLAMPYSTLLPLYAKTVFKGDVTTFSWLNSISGLGALLGAIFMANLKTGRNLLRIIIYATLLFCICLSIFSFNKDFDIALLFIMLAEAGMLAMIAATNTFIQTNVDEKMRGRVISYYVMAFQGMQPIGSLLVGASAHYFTGPHTVLIEGIAGTVVTLCFIPYFKRARKEQPKPIVVLEER